MAVLYETTLRMAEEFNPNDALTSLKTVEKMQEEIRISSTAVFSAKKEFLCEVCGYKIEGNHFFGTQHKEAVIARLKLEELKNEFGTTTRDESERQGMNQLREENIRAASAIKTLPPPRASTTETTSEELPSTPTKAPDSAARNPAKRGRSYSRSRSRSRSHGTPRKQRPGARSYSRSRSGSRGSRGSSLKRRARSRSRSLSGSRGTPRKPNVGGRSYSRSRSGSRPRIPRRARSRSGSRSRSSHQNRSRSRNRTRSYSRSPSPPPNNNKRNKPPCHFFRKGHCKWGNECRFAHVL
eukprot:Phypoly_transcript_06493.p1 GENE.Phypoly_transcript_06493~~Phypoly_transcript_06493.p1  ORF type:complete len:296 (+),score=31.77 Phypoly_transcript_06493:445-1332(+)